MKQKSLRLFKGLFFFVFIASLLWLLGATGLVDYSQILRAIRSNPRTIALILTLQGALLTLFSLRFWLILKSFKTSPTFKDVLAANCVSSAIGQWLPASLAVQETLRLGLMFGSRSAEDVEKTAPKSTVFMASLQDRIIGFTCTLFLGSVASLLLMTQMGGNAQEGLSQKSVLLLGGLSLLATLFLVIVPYAMRSGWGSRLWEGLMNFRPRFIRAEWIDEPIKLWSDRGRLHHNLHIFFWSLLALVTGPLTLSLSAYALGEQIDLSLALLISPALAIVTFLPVSLAGIGGAQFVAAGLFGFLGLSPQVAASASLLQATLSVLCTTIMGALFLPTSYAQVSRLLERKRLTSKP